MSIPSKDLPEEGKVPAPQDELHPDYEVADRDTMIYVRFIGNTPVIAGVGLNAATPFHMLAAAEYLRMQAEKMIYRGEAAIEAELARRQQMGKIEVAQNIPKL